MAITYPVAFPSEIPFQSTRFGLDLHQSTFQSISRKKTRQSWNEGKTDRWQGVITTPPLWPDELRIMSAWFRALVVDNGSFYVYDNRARDVEIAVVGTPLVVGAANSGGQIDTDGWGVNSTQVLKAGEYIQVGTQYFQLKEDATTDGSGAVTLEVMPNLRASPADNAPIVTLNPVLIAKPMKTDNDIDMDAAKTGVFSFAWEEEL